MGSRGSGEGKVRREDVPCLAELDFRAYREAARKSRGLTGQEYRLLDAIMDSADRAGPEAGGNAFPSRASLAGKIGRSLRSVDDLLTRLVTKGWLRRHPKVKVRDGRQTTDLFQLLRPPQDDPMGVGWEGPVLDRRPGVREPGPGSFLTSSPEDKRGKMP